MFCKIIGLQFNLFIFEEKERLSNLNYKNIDK